MLLVSSASLCLPVVPPPALAQAVPALQDDPAVLAAQQQLDAARARMAATSAELDDLAATFEQARGHAERLATELDQADDRVVAAEDAVAVARATQAQEVRTAYMQPGVDLARVSGAFLLAPDVGTALHASAMMQRVAANRAGDAESVRRAGQQVLTDVSSQRGVASGTAGAMQDLESLSETFTAVLDVAVGEVAAAEAALAEAQTAAQTAQAAADQAAADAALAQTFTGVISSVGSPAIRIATVNGGTQEMACPLGQPNGFIDSWGFPRSGGRRHQGVDMFAAYGMPIFAAADGTISRVFNNTLGGLSVDLIDVLGNRYYYAHLSVTYVSAGEPVQAGQLVAANGNSGNAISTPPHLHWQFHPGGGGPVNPYPLAAALCR